MVHLALPFGTFLHVCQILLHLSLLFLCCQLLYEFALRSQYHEGDTEDGICTGGEDSESHVAVSNLELHLRSFRTTNPVLLSFLQRVGPVDGLQSVEQSLSVCAHTQAPLAHLFLYYRIASTHTHTINNLVVGKHGAQSGTPVHHRLAQIGYTIVHQHLLLTFLVP